MAKRTAVDRSLSVNCILSIYLWGPFKQVSLAPHLYHIRFKHSYKIYKVI